MLGVLSLFLQVASPQVLSAFLGMVFTPFLHMTSLKNWTDVHLKWHLSLSSSRLTCLYIHSTLHSVSSWSLPSTSYPTTKMLSAMPNTFVKSLNISSIFLWTISASGASPNGNPLYFYLPNWHANDVRYDNFSSSFSL